MVHFDEDVFKQRMQRFSKVIVTVTKWDILLSGDKARESRIQMKTDSSPGIFCAKSNHVPD